MKTVLKLRFALGFCLLLKSGVALSMFTNNGGPLRLPPDISERLPDGMRPAAPPGTDTGFHFSFTPDTGPGFRPAAPHDTGTSLHPSAGAGYDPIHHQQSHHPTSHIAPTSHYASPDFTTHSAPIHYTPPHALQVPHYFPSISPPESFPHFLGAGLFFQAIAQGRNLRNEKFNELAAKALRLNGIRTDAIAAFAQNPPNRKRVKGLLNKSHANLLKEMVDGCNSEIEAIQVFKSSFSNFLIRPDADFMNENITRVNDLKSNYLQQSKNLAKWMKEQLVQTKAAKVEAARVAVEAAKVEVARVEAARVEAARIDRVRVSNERYVASRTEFMRVVSERVATARIETEAAKINEARALKINEAARTAVAGNIGGAMCFPGETPISLADDSPQGYHTVPISEIRKGDLVISCNLEKSGTCESGRVQAVVSRTVDHLLKFSIAGKLLRTTDNHPFYVVEKQDWIQAHDILRGDHLKTISGEVVSVDEIERDEGNVTVYNLDIDGNHNYYACDVLVHNCNMAASGIVIGLAGVTPIGALAAGSVYLGTYLGYDTISRVLPSIYAVGQIAYTHTLDRLPSFSWVLNRVEEGVDSAGVEAVTQPPQTNPYVAPVDRPVVTVDPRGNAIPVGTRERLTGSPDGRWVQVRGADGRPTGVRVDNGHPASGHPDHRAQQPHAHIPGRTNPDGTPWLPLNQ